MYIDEHILQEIVHIATYFPSITKIVLFGSRARGDHKHTSDIDLAIYTTDSLAAFTYRLQTEVSTLLDFDITDINTVDDPFFKDQINQEGVTIYEKPRF